MENIEKRIAHYHLPGLFEFYDLYRIFLPLFFTHREYFYDWCDIGSIYGAPGDALWGGGRVGYGESTAAEVISLMNEFNISARLTFSNSLLQKEHLSDRECNELCRLFCNSLLQKKHTLDRECNEPCESFRNSTDEKTRSSISVPTGSSARSSTKAENGIIICSDLLLEYIEKNYPGFYFVSSTTKVLTEFDKFVEELSRGEFSYVVADFRLNKEFDKLELLPDSYKSKVEFLCNECCWFECKDRKACYESVSRKVLGEFDRNKEQICTSMEGENVKEHVCHSPDGENIREHVCHSPEAKNGYVFSKAMKNPGFIGIDDIKDIYLPMGFSEFKIEGRSLGSAMILEFLLYYMTKPEYQLQVRENIYLDNTLDLF
jgi:hypothetical protein